MVSLDTVFALAVFGTVIAVALHTEGSLASSVNDLEQFRRAQDRLIDISDQLVLTRGEPDGWHNASEVKSIGLSYRDHRLSTDKLLALDRMTHRELRGNLSTGADSIFVELLNSGGGSCTVDGAAIEAGAEPSSARERLAIDRFVFTEGMKNCTLRVTLWRD